MSRLQRRTDILTAIGMVYMDVVDAKTPKERDVSVGTLKRISEYADRMYLNAEIARTADIPAGDIDDPRTPYSFGGEE